ncbi:MAG: PKD domain-containing protein [Thermoanaerobaculia bacterium]
MSVLAMAFVCGAMERPVAAQCTVTSPLRQFAPSGNPLGYGPSGHFKSGFATTIEMYTSGGAKKLIMHENFGYTTYDLSNPGAPVSSGGQDIENLQGTWAKTGDGFSTITTATVSADGSRALVGTRTLSHGTLLMKPNGTSFSFAGEFNPANASSLVVDLVNGRYIAYALYGQGSSVPLRVADVTNFVGAPNTEKVGSISSESVTGARVGFNMIRAGHYMVYSTGDGIAVIDGNNIPGSGGIAANIGTHVFSTGDFGLPGGHYVGDFAAAVHPVDGKLHIMVHTKTVGGSANSSGVALGRTSDGVNLTVVGAKLTLPGQWANATPVNSGSMVATADDLIVMTWARVISSGGYDNKLTTYSASGWGTDFTPSLVASSSAFQGSSGTLFATPVVMRGFAQGTQVNAYVGTGEAAFALSMTCSGSTSSPATADMIVQTDPGNVTLSDGANVFLGDKFKITPSVSPSPNTQPLIDWRFDYDFHASSSEDNGSLPRIKFPDEQGGATPPSLMSLVGPCDPSVSGTTASTGVGCWNSVTTNAFPSSDFSRAVAAGDSKMLTLALEARNANGSNGLRTFRLNFTVPRVKLKNSSFLSTTSSTAVLDGSEGTPQTSGYKWYFGGDPLAPQGEILTQDTSCAGAACNHTFAGKGNYNYFLSVPYANGYTSPDCANPCNQSLGSVAITDVVLAFTAPSSVQKANPTFTVTSQSTQGAVTSCSTGLEYNVCNATAGACSAGTYSPLSLSGSGLGGSASIPTPADPGSYYLRIRYNYQNASGCSLANWTPNTVAGSPTAWSFIVSNVTPTIRVGIAGAAPIVCGLGAGGGGNACQVTVGDALVAQVFVNGAADAGTGATWTAPGASPGTGSGGTYSFSYGSQGTKTLTLVGYGQTVTQGIDVGAAYVPVTPLTVNSVNASPSSASPNQAISFSASASGGTGSISYTWSFSDGGSGTGSSVSHAFASAGTFSGTVTARTTGGDSAARSVSVSIGTVVVPTNIDFTIKDDATGVLVQYSSAFGYGANSGQVLRMVPVNASGALSWDFGDGTSSTELSPAKTYTTATDKVYTVKLVANGQTRQATIEITGGLGPQLSGGYTYRYGDGTAVNTAVVTTGKSIRFTASDAADTFVWDFNDGTAIATTAIVDHTFNGYGTFRVVLSVTKAGLTPATTTSPTSFTIPPPPEPDQWLVPGMAYSEGQGGAQWQSDLSVYNPHTTQPMTISLAFLDGQVALTNPNSLVWSQYVLAKGQTITFANVLKNPPFSLPKGKYGAILVRGDVLPSQPVFSSRTYNSGTGSGTYGLSMAATAVSGGVHLGAQAPAAVAASRLIGLREDAGSYTNFGMANLKADYASVEVKFLDANGNPLGTPVMFNLNPYGVAQYNNVLSADPPLGAGYRDPVSTYSAAVRVISGTAVSPYATVIDRISKDPIFITPPTHPSSSYRLPGIIRAQGLNETLWRSNLVLYNPSASPRKVNLTYSFLSDNGLQARSSVSKFLDMAPNQILAADDFVKVWLNLQESDRTNFSNSWVDVSPAAGDTNVDPLLLMGHTYNNQPTGNVGLQIPGFTTDDGVSSLTTKKRLLMTGLTSSTAYRTNVAFFLVSQTAGGAAQANIKLLDSTGVVLKTVAISLDAFNAFVQKNDGELFGDIGGNKSNMSVVLENVSGSSQIAGYATVIDQISGDAILIAAQPAP